MAKNLNWEEIIEDFALVGDVSCDYSAGRDRGLDDAETERRARRAVALALDYLAELYDTDELPPHWFFGG